MVQNSKFRYELESEDGHTVVFNNKLARKLINFKSRLFRIGITGKRMSDVINLLQKHQINVLIDVRLNDFYKCKQGFFHDQFKEILAENNIEYKYYKTLGNPFHRELNKEVKELQENFKEKREKIEKEINFFSKSLTKLKKELVGLNTSDPKYTELDSKRQKLAKELSQRKEELDVYQDDVLKVEVARIEQDYKQKYLDYLRKTHYAINNRDAFPEESFEKLFKFVGHTQHYKKKRFCFLCYCPGDQECHTYWLIEALVNRERIKQGLWAAYILEKHRFKYNDLELPRDGPHEMVKTFQERRRF